MYSHLFTFSVYWASSLCPALALRQNLGPCGAFIFFQEKETINKEIYKKQMKLQAVITKLEGEPPGGGDMNAAHEEELGDKDLRERDQGASRARREKEPGML